MPCRCKGDWVTLTTTWIISGSYWMKRFTRRPGLLPYQSFLPPRLLKTRDSGPPACRPKTRRWIYSENTPPTITCWWAGPIWSAGARASLPMPTIATLWCSLMAPFGLPSPRYQGELMGVAQIIDHTGNRLARRHRHEGPGVITADLELRPGEPSLETPERFWIPELAWRFRFFWQQQNWCGRSLYQKARKQGWLQHQ